MQSLKQLNRQITQIILDFSWNGFPNNFIHVLSYYIDFNGFSKMNILKLHDAINGFGLRSM